MLAGLMGVFGVLARRYRREKYAGKQSAAPSILASEPFAGHEIGRPKSVFQVLVNVVARVFYSKGRPEVLKSLVNVPRIYFTEEFANDFENTARANVAREIESLCEEK